MEDSSGHFQMVGGAMCKSNKNAKALKNQVPNNISQQKNTGHTGQSNLIGLERNQRRGNSGDN